MKGSFLSGMDDMLGHTYQLKTASYQEIENLFNLIGYSGFISHNSLGADTHAYRISQQMVKRFLGSSKI